ncbi:Transcription initiation factor TFIID subunit 3 [Wickerhamomyces ciferrii]|uniref:Transcription initiation factor TFIID subunit 3 n=1 Tax=Wickerhamomyces ciferrii (strain ATCC 14091 / BCRC 22168 / CBS 111 / JCM 3599 / NBRC 0793 / NRRL Y-1031 F-60-10) TaxID=1206466 RepID=K0KRH2_WICCF|nr:Transcription initiation factor TFIID subunit 3 [Wickerhamomyces ciferrii]CCH43889.1 Transcription initiation factor TFIID subunit 3 [Wickerhamomyces ciferrii]
MGQSHFNFALLRVTVIQLLRSIGFDRCAPSLVDILADIYIRHLQLLASECMMLAENSEREEIEIQDITQGLQNIGMIKPTNLLDIYDQYEGTNKSADNFLLWVVGSIPENSRIVSKPTPEMSNTKKNKPNPVIPEYINALNSSNAAESTIDSMSKDTLNSQSQIQQQQQPEELDEDWLKFLMKKQSKIGHEEKFKHTVLNTTSNNTISDYNVVGPAHEELERKLPFNTKYDDELSDDEFIDNGHSTSRLHSADYNY